VTGGGTRGPNLGVGYIVRREPYELATAAGWLPGGFLVPRITAAVAIPRWGLLAAGVLLSLGALLTLAGLLGVAVERDDVRRVVARHVEQAGQILVAGMLTALAFGTGSASGGGLVRIVLEVAGAVGAGARATIINRTYTNAGRFL